MELLSPVENYFGGKGVIFARDVWLGENFETNWEYVRHFLIPPGCSIGLHRHDIMEVVYSKTNLVFETLNRVFLLQIEIQPFDSAQGDSFVMLSGVGAYYSIKLSKTRCF
ncbi:MAG: hypothetical protein FJ264_15880 [Planctomycetes bacterium]|nr:hypothetical protein [Planctomycetota bacterium]